MARLLQTGQVTIGQPAASASRWARVPQVGQATDFRSLGSSKPTEAHRGIPLMSYAMVSHGLTSEKCMFQP